MSKNKASNKKVKDIKTKYTTDDILGLVKMIDSVNESCGVYFWETNITKNISINRCWNYYSYDNSQYYVNINFGGNKIIRMLWEDGDHIITLDVSDEYPIVKQKIDKLVEVSRRWVNQNKAKEALEESIRLSNKKIETILLEANELGICKKEPIEEVVDKDICNKCSRLDSFKKFIGIK